MAEPRITLHSFECAIRRGDSFPRMHSSTSVASSSPTSLPPAS
ncbi:conserved hypothetical protein [Verticillium alfalfae VaMs.102]|uniref:Uncharacterized protein n=1 Tax=Verticillium alfalfae (strain VaMs.102 / ATCC MYA-4576 / FGSC 10136) TaxID=526221 RepID=C9S8F9_VERA1|nr:conserved hypothetical protein [Verticillium alfalfae VaMs.102]EEY15349.1 conserved hypothetical protein [Verticillium alfalfae VaMs.102]